MREKIKLFRESLKLVWNSAPGWTLINIIMSVLRSIFPLLLIWLLKVVVDDITKAATAVSSRDKRVASHNLCSDNLVSRRSFIGFQQLCQEETGI